MKTKNNLQPNILKMYSALDSPLGEFCEGFKWVEGGFGPKTEEIAFSDLPKSEGKIVCRYEDKEVIVYDLAWGEYNEIGSIRGTFRFVK